MRHRTTSSFAFAVVLAVITLTARAGAQATSPAPLPLSSIPATPAGNALREWFDAMNSGDSTRMDAFLRAHRSEGKVAGLLGFRRMTGGFDLLAITRSEARHIGFFVRERRSPMTAIGELDLPEDGAFGIVGPNLQALGPDVPLSALRIDAATRARVVRGAVAMLDSFYVFPEVAKRLGDSSRARLARGAYDRYDDGPAFARRLTEDFAAIAHDKHLDVRFNGGARPAPPPAPTPVPASGAPTAPSPPAGPSAEDLARERRMMDERNCGFDKVERLAGNVGYLKFDMFADPELCAPTASAALTLLAGTRALIIDLRENGGGAPKMVSLVASYLFDRRTHLNDLWTRSTNTTAEFWTEDSVPGRRFGGEKPVVLLTAARTFSGAEEFAYDLKALKRATIVGETTGGGAHPVRARRIDERFMIGVPFARAINPVTHTNWEGVGIEPDMKVPAAEALATALRLLDRPKP